MIRSFKATFPDLAPEDGKRVLWFADWHDSRVSKTFIDAMRDLGVVMVGWLPNCTSKMQLADVSLFGDFKCQLEAMGSGGSQRIPGSN